MAQVEKLLIFLASPGDVPEERSYVEEVIGELNRTVAPDKEVVLQVVRWEKDTFPGYGSDAQAIVNKQIAEMAKYSLFIGIMWNRLGTPTPRSESGTVEEFERAAAALAQQGKPEIWFYFREAPAELITDDQRAKVQAFKARIQANGLPCSYGTAIEFRDKLRQQMTLWLERRQAKPQSSAELQISSLIRLLSQRAEAIQLDLEEVIKELERLHKGQAIEKLRELEARFVALHEKHLTAIKTGDLGLSHEIVGDIHELLAKVRDVVSATVGATGREWFASLNRRYINTPDRAADPQYAAVQDDLLKLHQATTARTSAMHYPGKAPATTAHALIDLAFGMAAPAKN